MNINNTELGQWMEGMFEKLDDICQDLRSLIGNMNIFAEDDKLLDNQDLAFLLKVSKRTLQRYRSEKKLTYFMIGHKTLYRVRDVKEFIKKCESYHNSRTLTP